MAVETKLPRAAHHKKCYGEDLDGSMQSREGVTCINRLLMATGAALTICTASGLFRRGDNQADGKESVCNPQALEESLEYFL